jgi:Winged helix DNA-binding domain
MMRIQLPAAFADHARAIRASQSAGKGQPADAGTPTVDRRTVGWFRARAMHLAERVPAGPGCLAAAAQGGLQDTAPRAALLALAARARGVGPGSWEHPEVVQVWFRQADYLVPRADVGVFTRGTMPRDPALAAALERVADHIHSLLDGEPQTTRALMPAVPELPGDYWVRMTAATGRLHIRWDARFVHVLPVEAPDVDDEEARLELARRYLRWHGPADDRQFARWAGVSRADAAETWRGLGAELVPVALDGRARSLLATDEPRLTGAAPPAGARFLPMGDPYLHLDTGTVVPPAPPAVAERQPEPGVSRRLLNSLACRVMVDGDLVASWGRAAGKLTIAPWGPLDPATRDAVDRETATMGAALGRPLTVRWLDAA